MQGTSFREAEVAEVPNQVRCLSVAATRGRAQSSVECRQDPPNSGRHERESARRFPLAYVAVYRAKTEDKGDC